LGEFLLAVTKVIFIHHSNFNFTVKCLL